MIADYIKRNVSARAAQKCAALGGLVLLLACVVEMFPGLQGVFEFNRTAIAAGEYWRIGTCHFVHWGWAHLAGDISGLLGLWWLLREEIGSRKFVWFSGVMFVLVGLSVYFDSSELEIYRGMSGMNHALLGWVLMKMFIDTPSSARWMPAILLLVLFVKVICELYGMFTMGTGLPTGITVVSVVHIVGLAGGMIFGCITSLYKKHCMAFVNVNPVEQCKGHMVL